MSIIKTIYIDNMISNKLNCMYTEKTYVHAQKTHASMFNKVLLIVFLDWYDFR